MNNDDENGHEKKANVMVLTETAPDHDKIEAASNKSLYSGKSRSPLGTIDSRHTLITVEDPEDAAIKERKLNQEETHKFSSLLKTESINLSPAISSRNNSVTTIISMVSSKTVINPDGKKIMIKFNVTKLAGQVSEENGLLTTSQNGVITGNNSSFCTIDGTQYELIDALDEECFTLDSFESLIQTTKKSGKDFLIARVTTADPSEPDKFYFSYYAAFQINKVLFRTQPSEGLLHRMKARNPLNNMPIVGDVFYFAITPTKIDEAWKNCDNNIDPPFDSKKDAEKYSSTVIYHADYIGNDDNFLLSSAFREYFKCNAVAPDDCTLFVLNRPNPQAGPEPDNGTLEPLSFWNLWGLLTRRRLPVPVTEAGEAAGANAEATATPRPTSNIRRMTKRGLQVFMVLYVVTGFVLIKFVFPSNFAYLIGFIMIMLFMFTLLFLVDCDA